MELKLTPRFLQNGQRFFGPGVAELLERVREHRSLRAAAASMEMAYSKAWRIIHEAEEGFGFRLLDSTIGGLSMFLYGIEVMGDGLKNSSGAALKRIFLLTAKLAFRKSSPNRSRN